MIAYPYGALFVGVMLLLTGIVSVVRAFLLDPHSSRYPKAPSFVRHTIFGFGTIMAWLGLHYLTVFLSDSLPTSPPQPGAEMQFMSLILAVYKSILLANIVRQRYPEEVWTKLNRLNDALPCKDRKFLAWLSK
jgi:uncharacterized membrane protein HdeD (DUF308 family)